MHIPFTGNMTIGTAFKRAGFMAGIAMSASSAGLIVPTALAQQSVAATAANATTPLMRAELSPELNAHLERFERGEMAGDLTSFARDMANELSSIRSEVNRAIEGQTSGSMPTHENLEAPALILVPKDTPFRNRVPRTVGNGAAAVWKQVVSLGGGWGNAIEQPGGGDAATRIFYAELGAPESFRTEYATRTAQYKLMGAYGGVTMFGAAAGANYQDQRAAERRNALGNFMLNEENAMINAVRTALVAPWGDGTAALAYDGLGASINTANGTPSAAVQTAVGPISLDHYNEQLRRLWTWGGRDLFILQGADRTMDMQKLLRDSGEPYRLTVLDQGEAKVGFRVAVYVHPVSGENVVIMTSRFVAPDTIYFGAMTSDNGENALELEVLPQAPLPPDIQRPEGSKQEIQGYYVQELARSVEQPEVEPFLVNLYSTFKLKNAKLFCKSTGVTSPA